MQNNSAPPLPSIGQIITRDSVFSFEQPADGDIPLAILPVAQSDTPEPHSHDFVEIVFVRSGSGHHCLGKHRYPIFAGDCFVIAPGERHGYEQGKELNIINMLFYPGLLAPFKDHLEYAPGLMRFLSIEPLFRSETSFRYKLHLGPAMQRHLAVQCTRLKEELTDKKPGFQPMCVALFLELLVQIGRQFESSLGSADVRHDFEGKERVVAAAISYLEQHYARSVSVADVARHSYISPSRLSHVFKEATNMSLIDYLTKLRIDQACKLLTQSQKTISEIAADLGFHDPSYFGRIFKQQAGKSPLAYRRSATA
jgi:AraC-like DNA-binding protein/quercetin dioxygenase-like cupin family protein